MITIDLDEPETWEIARSWYALYELGDDIQGKLSKSGTGVHIEVFDDGYSREETTYIRANYGDDKWRVVFDFRYAEKPDQILFSGPYPWVSDVWNLIDQYVWERDGPGVRV